MQLSIVIPVLNEEGNIFPVGKEIIHTLERYEIRYEIIYVDDGSDDTTYSKITKLKRMYPQYIRHTRHKINYGQSNAIRTGVHQARADWVLIMDGDGQCDPTDIMRFFDFTRPALNTHKPRLVIGKRNTDYCSWGYKLLFRIRRAMYKLVLKDTTQDTQCGMKLIKRETFLLLPFFENMHRYIPSLINKLGGDVTSLEVNYRPRLSGYSKNSTLDYLGLGLIELVGVRWLLSRNKLPEFKT